MFLFDVERLLVLDLFSGILRYRMAALGWAHDGAECWRTTSQIRGRVMTSAHPCYDQSPNSLVYHREKAGEGNRTPVCSLGSCRSTIELHPQKDFRFSIVEGRLQLNSRARLLPGDDIVVVNAGLLTSSGRRFRTVFVLTERPRDDTDL